MRAQSAAPPPPPLRRRGASAARPPRRRRAARRVGVWLRTLEERAAARRVEQPPRGVAAATTRRRIAAPPRAAPPRPRASRAAARGRPTEFWSASSAALGAPRRPFVAPVIQGTTSWKLRSGTTLALFSRRARQRALALGSTRSTARQAALGVGVLDEAAGGGGGGLGSVRPEERRAWPGEREAPMRGPGAAFCVESTAIAIWRAPNSRPRSNAHRPSSHQLPGCAADAPPAAHRWPTTPSRPSSTTRTSRSNCATSPLGIRPNSASAATTPRQARRQAPRQITDWRGRRQAPRRQARRRQGQRQGRRLRREQFGGAAPRRWASGFGAKARDALASTAARAEAASSAAPS